MAAVVYLALAYTPKGWSLITSLKL